MRMIAFKPAQTGPIEPVTATLGSMPNKPKTPLRAIRISDEVWMAARAKAAEEGTTVSEVVRGALVKFAAKRERARK